MNLQREISKKKNRETQTKRTMYQADGNKEINRKEGNNERNKGPTCYW
jgi:hypothetical protein